MAILLLVAGLPGSGKSFFADRLADAIGATPINSDRVRILMHARGKYAIDDKFAVYHRMALEAGNLLRNGTDVIVDATFYLKSLRDLFFRIGTEHNARIYLIEIQADEEIIKKRISVDRVLSEADFSVFKKIKGEYEAIADPHLILRSSDDNIEQMIAQTRAYLELKEKEHER